MEYICDLCGFSYNTEQRGPIPPDYSCPICGGGRTHFLPEDGPDTPQVPDTRA